MTVLLNEAGDSVSIEYASEFGLRDSLAKLADINGWTVETEHVVSGWGRPDLYLTSGETVAAVELKLNLDTPSQCRRAIQQAESYRVAMPEVTRVFLVASRINVEAMQPYRDAYWRVETHHAGAFMHWLQVDPLTVETRAPVAESRRAAVAEDLRLRDLHCKGIATALARHMAEATA